MMRYPDKTIYRGEWRNDKKCGVGELITAENDEKGFRYIGEFYDDKKDG